MDNSELGVGSNVKRDYVIGGVEGGGCDRIEWWGITGLQLTVPPSPSQAGA